MAVSQRQQALKFELLIPYHPTARADRMHELQLPPWTFRHCLGHQDGAGEPGAHRLRGVRHGPTRGGPVRRPWRRIRRAGRGRRAPPCHFERRRGHAARSARQAVPGRLAAGSTSDPLTATMAERRPAIPNLMAGAARWRNCTASRTTHAGPRRGSAGSTGIFRRRLARRRCRAWSISTAAAWSPAARDPRCRGALAGAAGPAGWCRWITGWRPNTPFRRRWRMPSPPRSSSRRCSEIRHRSFAPGHRRGFGRRDPGGGRLPAARRRWSRRSRCNC